MMDFDWYQGTVCGVSSENHVASRLLKGVGPLTLKEAAGGFNRPYSMRGSLDHGSLGIYYGGGLDVHVVATSGLAPHAARVLRAEFPDHTVSRVDVAYDVDEPGSFERLHKITYLIARQKRRGPRGGVVGTELAGDWLDAIGGRTLYAGGRSSRLRVRVYEKGKEQEAKHPDRKFSHGWTRVEWQIRPDSAGKRLAATLEPLQLAAWSAFGAALVTAVTSIGMTPLAPQRVPATDAEYWLGRQYSKILREWVLLPPADLQNKLLAVIERAGSTPNPFTESARAEHVPAAGLVLDRG